METKPKFITVKTSLRGCVFVNPKYIVSITPFLRSGATKYYVRFQDGKDDFRIGTISEEDYKWLVETEEK